jgi:hypothetical protein
LAAVPHEAEWFANIDNPRTRRAYRSDIHEFMGFVQIGRSEEFRTVTRAHALAWRKDLEGRELSGTTIRHKVAALSSLFEHLCDANAVTHNPVKGVKRPKVESYEGKTPALGRRRGAGHTRRARAPDREGQAGSRHPLGVALPLSLINWGYSFSRDGDGKGLPI